MPKDPNTQVPKYPTTARTQFGYLGTGVFGYFLLALRNLVPYPVFT
jgi:hypothetical protein